MSSLPPVSIRAYDQDLNLLAIIDICSTVYFERGLSEAGAFELQINYNLLDSAGYRYSDYFQRGNFICVGTDMRRIGIIMEITKAISEGGKGSQVVSVKGYEAKALFGRRLVEPAVTDANYTDSNPAETVMKNVIISQVGTGASASRQMSIFNILASSGAGATFQYSSRLKNLADDIKMISESTGIGISNTLNLSTKKIDIDAIVGVNRIASQSTNPRCIISTKYDTLRAGQLTDSEVTYKNVVVAAGQGVGVDRNIQVVYDGAEPTGLERREVMQDMRDLETTPELLARASSTLQELSVTKFVDASALSYSQYVLGVDYDLGDYITTEIYDESEDVQITKVKESWAPNQYNIELVFNRAYPEMPKQIKAREQATAQVLANVETGTGLNSSTVGGNTAAQLLDLGNATGTLADARLSAYVNTFRGVLAANTDLDTLTASGIYAGGVQTYNSNPFVGSNFVLNVFYYSVSVCVQEAVESVSLRKKYRLNYAGWSNWQELPRLDASNTFTAVSNIISGHQLTNGGGLELNYAGTGNRNAYIDFHSADSPADYSCRIIRTPGVNGILQIEQKGTGGISIEAPVIYLPNYTMLGPNDGAHPAVRIKYITGNTLNVSAGALKQIPHGLTASKILSVSCKIEYSSDGLDVWIFPERASMESGQNLYSVYINGGNIGINVGPSATTILNRVIVITIMYME
jgi:hypothetical protein